MSVNCGKSTVFLRGYGLCCGRYFLYVWLMDLMGRVEGRCLGIVLLSVVGSRASQRNIIRGYKVGFVALPKAGGQGQNRGGGGANGVDSGQNREGQGGDSWESHWNPDLLGFPLQSPGCAGARPGIPDLASTTVHCHKYLPHPDPDFGPIPALICPHHCSSSRSSQWDARDRGRGNLLLRFPRAMHSSPPPRTARLHFRAVQWSTRRMLLDVCGLLGGSAPQMGGEPVVTAY